MGSGVKGFLYEIKKNRILYLMCVPALIVLIMFSYIPFAGVWMAFTDFNVVDGIFGSKFVGLDNFKYFFSANSMGWKVTYNTLYINFFGLILGIIIPVTIAIMINEIRHKTYKKIAQSMMFFPYFISWVVVGAILYGIFSTDVGVANHVLEFFGAEPIRWYSEPKYWKWIIILSSVWKWSGYSSIIYMAAMSNFDGSLYEAAKVDGANKLQRILFLTVPMLKPTIIVLSLLSVGRIFYGDFGMIYGIVGNNPVLAEEVTVIDTYVYQSMRTLGFSYSTAIGLFQSLMGLILITAANKSAKKINDGEGLF
ncbi:binding-protein-dependent transport systems inner membrane component [Paenibacillus vortex V453]|jgi:putative aldouronate transport system permease protein|uniref:Sugar ABC transporter permease n=3 Tax=Paenibacillus TaxID=44249 RepID=A0A163LZW9_9BACL|nr:MULTISPECIES: ABC transporter permease subunit [Paenibacillus]ANA82549.1 sugar ABC transporter permease [Paenibacillus glucanolyticus]AVV58711.1 sugar ABC transporter permease [Paenibacillus glucanolyticus]AWP27900.1 sugar ABC transporter permease [Paenibacillus sp. Cedars]EFU40971.1 binding-protein-dependent transport systems inner membrane component [Paenibacillus vortex V453]ETT39839.1 binding-protein-dependent transport systems inner membrane component [Paenibacillus sp. FSL R5-808]